MHLCLINIFLRRSLKIGVRNTRYRYIRRRGSVRKKVRKRGRERTIQKERERERENEINERQEDINNFIRKLNDHLVRERLLQRRKESVNIL